MTLFFRGKNRDQRFANHSDAQVDAHFADNIEKSEKCLKLIHYIIRHLTLAHKFSLGKFSYNYRKRVVIVTLLKMGGGGPCV